MQGFGAFRNAKSSISLVLNGFRPLICKAEPIFQQSIIREKMNNIILSSFVTDRSVVAMISPKQTTIINILVSVSYTHLSSGSEDAASIVLVLLSRAASFILVSAFVQPDTNRRKSENIIIFLLLCLQTIYPLHLSIILFSMRYTYKKHLRVMYLYLKYTIIVTFLYMIQFRYNTGILGDLLKLIIQIYPKSIIRSLAAWSRFIPNYRSLCISLISRYYPNNYLLLY